MNNDVSDVEAMPPGTPAPTERAREPNPGTSPSAASMKVKKKLFKLKDLRQLQDTEANNDDSQFKKVLRTRDLISLGVGSCVGTGMYLVSGLVAKKIAGPAVVLSYLIAGFAALLSGACYSELAVRVPRTTGSAYIYTYVTVGEFIAFIIGWNMILEYVIGSAACARALSICVDIVTDGALSNITSAWSAPSDAMNDYGGAPDFPAFVITVLMMCLFFYGVKKSVIFNHVLNAINILTWVAIFLGGMLDMDFGNWSNFMPFGFSGVLKGASICFYSFIGFDIIATTGEETENPKRSIPKAIMISLTVVTVAYASCSSIMTLLVPYNELSDDSGLIRVWGQINRPGLEWVVSIGALAGLTVSMYGSMFPMPRIAYAMANDGLLCHSFRRVNRFGVPGFATLCLGLLAAFLTSPEVGNRGWNWATSLALARELIHGRNEYQRSQVCTVEGGRLVVKVLISLVCCFILFDLLLVYSEESSPGLGVTTICIFVLALLIICHIVSIAQFPQNRPQGFNTYGVPLVPSIGVLINIYLMMRLSPVTWMRFSVWMIIDEASSIISVGKSLVGRAVFWSLLFSLGLWQWHPVWILLPMSMKFFWKRSQSSHNRPGPTLHGVSDFPTWVYFPDAERAEWINAILQQLWPALQEHMDQRLRQMTQPGELLQGLNFTSTSLGQIPPRVEGVKVYKTNQVSRNEIIVDVNLVFASNCYLKAGLWSWFGLAIRDLYLHGTLRITMCPLLKDLPLVGNIEVAFIAPPGLDFDMEGVANILDMPGLSRLVRKLVIEQISAFMVIPNVLKTPMVSQAECELLKYCPTQFKSLEVVRITIIEAKDLKGMDFVFLGKRTADPYCVIKIGAQVGTTEIVKENLNPKWNFSLDFIVDATHLGVLELDVWDWDKGKSDDFMGRVVMALDQLFLASQRGPLALALDGPQGRISFASRWFDLTSDMAALDERDPRSHPEVKAVLQLYVDCCKNLVNKKGRSPKVKLTLKCGRYPAQESRVQDYSQNPEIEEEFAFLVTNPLSDKLVIEIQDTKYGKDLGLVKVSLSELLSRPNLRLKSQPFRVEQARSNGQIVMELQLKFLRLSQNQI
eukprot:maker-scaffold438_size171652-snap-gene-0.39 protein:Tk03141 transcript:maker-scaffold438_size171652-snap-gene-0.39-mRNA-1 annotation:"hypothetical protein KGM_14024"